MKVPAIPARVINELATLFRRNGYVRPPLKKRKKDDSPGVFRRGFEFRLTASTKEELRHIRQLLKQAHFKPASAFIKSNQYRQPVYGRESLERFLRLIEADDV
jgi:hypothetical protein